MPDESPHLVTEAELIEAFRWLGVEGEWAMLHSSYKSIAPVEHGPYTVYHALRKAVGVEGMTFIPTFNFTSWTMEHYYSLDWTPSEMGIITEMARKDNLFARSDHPIYNFAYFPPVPNWQDKQHAFDGGGLFHEFKRHDGILINLGVKREDENIPWPMVHYAEYMSAADYYRETKTFGGLYVTGDVITTRTYSITVRRPKVWTRVKPAIDYLIKEGVVFETDICGTYCQYAHASAFVAAMIEICHDHPEWLYSKG